MAKHSAAVGRHGVCWHVHRPDATRQHITKARLKRCDFIHPFNSSSDIELKIDRSHRKHYNHLTIDSSSDQSGKPTNTTTLKLNLRWCCWLYADPNSHAITCKIACNLLLPLCTCYSGLFCALTLKSMLVTGSSLAAWSHFNKKVVQTC